jgi:hypothetical protein
MNITSKSNKGYQSKNGAFDTRSVTSSKYIPHANIETV